MPINKIEKRSGTSHLENLPNASGFGYDSDDGFYKYNDAGTIRTIVDTAKTQTVTGNKTFSGTNTFSGSTTLSGTTTISGTLSTTATGQIRFATTTITNAEFLAIRAAPKTLVAAPGAGFALQFIAGTLSIDYTAAYTETTDNLAIKYTDGSGQAASATIETTGFVDLTADSMVNIIPTATGPQIMTANAALVLHNTGDGEFGGGNAANVMTATVVYRVIAFPL